MEKVTDEVAKRIFKVLCNEEMGHIDYLREHLDEWRKTGEISEKKLRTSIGAKREVAPRPLPIFPARRSLAPNAAELRRLRIEVDITPPYRKLGHPLLWRIVRISRVPDVCSLRGIEPRSF